MRGAGEGEGGGRRRRKDVKWREWKREGWEEGGRMSKGRGERREGMVDEG